MHSKKNCTVIIDDSCYCHNHYEDHCVVSKNCKECSEIQPDKAKCGKGNVIMTAEDELLELLFYFTHTIFIYPFILVLLKPIQIFQKMGKYIKIITILCIYLIYTDKFSVYILTFVSIFIYISVFGSSLIGLLENNLLKILSYKYPLKKNKYQCNGPTLIIPNMEIKPCGGYINALKTEITQKFGGVCEQLTTECNNPFVSSILCSSEYSLPEDVSIVKIPVKLVSVERKTISSSLDKAIFKDKMNKYLFEIDYGKEFNQKMMEYLCEDKKKAISSDELYDSKTNSWIHTLSKKYFVEESYMKNNVLYVKIYGEDMQLEVDSDMNRRICLIFSPTHKKFELFINSFEDSYNLVYEVYSEKCAENPFYKEKKLTYTVLCDIFAELYGNDSKFYNSMNYKYKQDDESVWTKMSFVMDVIFEYALKIAFKMYLKYIEYKYRDMIDQVSEHYSVKSSNTGKNFIKEDSDPNFLDGIDGTDEVADVCTTDEVVDLKEIESDQKNITEDSSVNVFEEFE